MSRNFPIKKKPYTLSQRSIHTRFPYVQFSSFKFNSRALSPDFPRATDQAVAPTKCLNCYVAKQFPGPSISAQPAWRQSICWLSTYRTGGTWWQDYTHEEFRTILELHSLSVLSSVTDDMCLYLVTPVWVLRLEDAADNSFLEKLITLSARRCFQQSCGTFCIVIIDFCAKHKGSYWTS